MAKDRVKSETHTTVTLNLDNRIREEIDATVFRVTHIAGAAILEFLRLPLAQQEYKIRQLKKFEADPKAKVRERRVAVDE